MQERYLLLISRDDILENMAGEHDTRLFRLLARFTRSGYHLLATAAQPEQWSSKHGGPDEALLGPNSIRKHLSDAGGALDGVYYVPRSLLTQRRNRVQALQDMLQRYAVNPDHCYLFSSSRPFVAVANELGIHATGLDGKTLLLDCLKELAERVLD
jgi:hypothetical protein